MTRAAICGGPGLVAAATAVGLTDGEPAQLAIVDLRDQAGLARAATLPPDLPRVLVADVEAARLLRAAGARHLTESIAPEALGPLVADVLPSTPRGATRRIVVTAGRGGVGRTLLATNLGRRISRRCPLWVVDATGTGAAAWWLRAEARPWSELEPLARELSIEQLRVVAAEPITGLRVLGGGGAAPTPGLLSSCLAMLAGSGEPAIVDASLLGDERTRMLMGSEEEGSRALVVSYADAASLAALEPHDLAHAWLIASQARALGERRVFRALPRDEPAVAEAHCSRSGVAGALGRAYDELAELLAIDIS